MPRNSGKTKNAKNNFNCFLYFFCNFTCKRKIQALTDRKINIIPGVRRTTIKKKKNK